MSGLMQPGPTQYEAEQLRKKRGSQGLLGAIGEPMSYSPNPLVNALGSGLLGAQYLTGEKPMDEGLSALAMMTGLLQGTKVAPIMRNAIKVYHGSPHKYDKPDSSKIGTGEGAQSYGHGLYWAETPEVARSYMNSDMRQPIKTLEIGGKRPELFSGPQGIPTDNASKNYNRAIMALQEGQSVDKAKKIAQSDDVRAVIDKLAPQVAYKDRGQLYEASLRWPDAAREAADPLSAKHFLDWDKPLSEQSESVQKALRQRVRDQIAKQGTPKHLVDYYTDRKMGEDVLKEALYRDGGKNRASEILNELGIPGITYLDAGSRTTGEGTRNFVTVNDALVELLKRNGVGLLGK